MKLFSERLNHAWDDCGFECERDTEEVDALIKEASQLEERVEALENTLWKCRHGGKDGIPIDYQEEVDNLLATYQVGRND